MAKEHKRLVFTRHAENVVAERALKLEWIELAVHASDWEMADPVQPGAVRRFRAIGEHEDRIMRVVCLEIDMEIRILTAFFDRRARKPK